MSEDTHDPCKEVLRRFEQEHLSEVKHDVSEIVTVAAIVGLYVLCVLLSVAVDLTTAIETLPALSMIGWHKREAIKTVASKVPPVRLPGKKP